MGAQQSVWIHNHIPSRKAGSSPHDLWSKTKCPLCELRNVHAFGCPVCIPRKCLPDRMSAPQWEKRSRQGMCVGMSERHAGNVPLILNFKTGDITAQRNVVFGNWISTVATNVEDMPDFHADKWSRMFGTSPFNSEPDSKVKEPDQQPAQPTGWDVKDNTVDKKEELQQQMSAPNQLTQPGQPTVSPARTHSEVASERIN